MTKYYITLEKDGFRYSAFVLGYDKDGGYFISDLSKKGGNYFILRMKAKLRGFGTQRVPVDHKNEWVVSYKPKLMCHFDGSCQISGSGIRSGFYKLTRRPKGVATQSPCFNDGGPIFGFLCWGLDQFPIDKGRNRICVIFDSASIHIDPYLGHDNGLHGVKYDAYVFEGFYLPNAAVKHLDLATGIIRYKHPNFGIIPLKYIPPPKNSAGFIAIGCRPTGHGFKTDYGLTYGGGVSIPDQASHTTQIQVIFPSEGNITGGGRDSHHKMLDFNLRSRIMSHLDNKLSWLINFIKNLS